MSEFLEDLGSVYWWLSVVLVSLVVSIAAPSVRDFLGALISRMFGKVRDSSRQLAAYEKDTLDRLRTDPHLQVMLGFDEIRHYRIATLFLIPGASFLGAGSVAPGARGIAFMAFGALQLYWGGLALFVGSRIGALLRKACPLPFARPSDDPPGAPPS